MFLLSSFDYEGADEDDWLVNLQQLRQQLPKLAIVGLPAFGADGVHDPEVGRPGIDLCAGGAFYDVTLLAPLIFLERGLGGSVQVALPLRRRK